MDNDRFTLAVLAATLKKHLPGWHILDPVDKASLAVSVCLSHHPPTVLLGDISMSDMNGLLACTAIRRENFSTAILMMSSFNVDHFARKAAAAGAQGIIHKDDPALIAEAIIRISSGSSFPYKNINFDSSQDAFYRIRNSKNTELSPREAEIVDLWCTGESMQQISEKLGISQTTVRTHLQNAAKKLGVPNNRALILAWSDLNH